MPYRPDHHQDAHFRVLRLLEQDPQRTQREIAAALGISLGQTNFLLKALLAQGYLKLGTFQRPSGLHPEQTILAARHGVHVMTEKPMATRWQDGLRMVEACDEAGVRLFVVKQNRRNATLQLLKRAVEQKRFGKIYAVSVNVFWTRPQEYYDSAKWRGTWEFDGGAFMNQASHYIDLLDWLIGPVESVMAYTGTLERDIEVEDSGVAAIRWRSGAMGTLNVSMLTYPKNLEGSITILGEKGTVRIGGVAVNEIQHWDFAEQPPTTPRSSRQLRHHQRLRLRPPALLRQRDQTLRGEAEPETDGREGLKSLELLIAAYLSARDGGNHCKVQNNVSIYDAVTLEDDVFCGPSMVFTNVHNPRAAVIRKDQYRRTWVKKGATIGANATLVCGVTLGEYAFIAAGAVITHDVKPYALMAGVPARQIGWMSQHGERLDLPLTGQGSALCPHTGTTYILQGEQVSTGA
jgi:UDP-N-acetyl-2-amino-2-deoxyglucuronate dehydrogenase